MSRRVYPRNGQARGRARGAAITVPAEEQAARLLELEGAGLAQPYYEARETEAAGPWGGLQTISGCRSHVGSWCMTCTAEFTVLAMPLTGWEAYSAWKLARHVQEFGCMIPDHDCELRWNLNDGRLWIGIAASSIVLGSSECRSGRFHLTILTATGVARSPAPALWERLARSLKKSLSSTPVVVAGDPDPIMDPPTDLPHRVILTLHVRSVLHAQLFSARNVLLRHFDCGRPDHRTSFHLSIDYFVLGEPVALPGPTF